MVAVCKRQLPVSTWANNPKETQRKPQKK